MLLQGQTDLSLIPAANIVVLENTVWQVKGLEYN
jgi:hypothetical protein